jgi:hypothetical protein
VKLWDTLYFNKHRHWAPRVGGAYQVTDRLVFRGGDGVFNMALHLDNINTALYLPLSQP